MGWLEGALRLMPSFQLHMFGYRVPEIVVPAVLLPRRRRSRVLYAWPAIDKRLTSDRLRAPPARPARDDPMRTAFGVAVLTFYVVLFVGGSQDVIAQELRVSIDPVTWRFGSLCSSYRSRPPRSHTRSATTSRESLSRPRRSPPPKRGRREREPLVSR